MNTNSSGAAVAVVPSDTVPIGFTTSRLYVGGAGNVTVRMASGQLVLFTGVLAGTILPIQFTHVMATGTAATLMVALS